MQDSCQGQAEPILAGAEQVLVDAIDTLIAWADESFAEFDALVDKAEEVINAQKYFPKSTVYDLDAMNSVREAARNSAFNTLTRLISDRRGMRLRVNATLNASVNRGERFVRKAVVQSKLQALNVQIETFASISSEALSRLDTAIMTAQTAREVSL